MVSIASAKGSSFRRHGPVIFTETSGEGCLTKLLAFCKKSFPYMSKNGLQKCFLAGSVFVNDVPVRCGHEDEYKILRHQDKVEIIVDLDAADALIIASTHLDVLHIQSGCAVIVKASGESAAFDKGLDKALKSKLWDGKRKKECQLLYHLEKGCSGICIVAETAEHLLELRSMCCKNRHVRGANTVLKQSNVASNDPSQLDISVNHDVAVSSAPSVMAATADETNETDEIDGTADQEPFLELAYRCIICGTIGEVNEVAFIETGHKDYPIIEAKVLQISRCRSKGFISLVDVRVTFDFTRMGHPAESEGCHSDYYTEYYGDCIGDNGSNHSNSDDDDNGNENDNVDDVIDGEEGNREQNTQLNDTEESSNNAHIRSIPAAAFTVENIRKPVTAADYRYLHYPTLRIRTVKRALSLCGHQIVGDGGAVKSAKGLFACIVSVTISGIASDPRSPVLPSEGEKEDVEKEEEEAEEEEDVHRDRLHGLSVSKPTASRTPRSSRTFSVDDPKKFSKLMIKEQELWESAQRRDSEVMMAWQALSLQPSANVLEDIEIEFLPLQETSQKDSYVGSVIDETNTLFKGNESDSRVESPIQSNSNSKSKSNSNSNSNVATRFKSFEDMKDAMASGMPVEYVLGEATFCGFKFRVNNAVMVPRKSSEVLVLEAVKVVLNNMILEVGDGCENKYKNRRENENKNKNDRIAFVTEPEIRQKRVRVLDIGTGSGCLLLSCLNNLKNVLNDGAEENADAENEDIRANIEVDSNYIIEGVGIDLFESALQVAHTNAITLNLHDSTVFKIQDFAHLEDLVPTINMTHTAYSSPLTGPCGVTGSGSDMTVSSVESTVQDPLISTTEKCLGPYDIVLCNPPYSSRRDTTRLSVACREHEPSVALFSPDGPLSAYRTLAASLTACEAKRTHFTAVESSGIPLGPGTGTETGIPLGSGTGIPLGPGTGIPLGPGAGIPLGPGTGIPLGHGAVPGIFNINAHLFLEVGHGQALPVQKIFSKLQFMTFIGVTRDHKDIDRCLMYRYNGL